MSVEIRSEDHRSLAAYATIPIAFEIREALSRPTLGLIAGPLESHPVARAYVKGYDALPRNHPLDWPSRFDVRRAHFLAAYLGARRVGGAVVIVDPADATRLGSEPSLALLWDLRVAPDVRRRGIGHALLTIAESHSRATLSHGLVVETQDVNVPACRFYAGAGYALTRITPSAYPTLPDEMQLVWTKSFE